MQRCIKTHIQFCWVVVLNLFTNSLGIFGNIPMIDVAEKLFNYLCRKFR